MNALTVLIALLAFQSTNALLKSLKPNIDNGTAEEGNKLDSVNGTQLDFLYSNSFFGNDESKKIEFGNESSIVDYWLEGLPLKVITHGWLSSDENFDGVFSIKTAYINVGGYNVISVDWSSIAKDINYVVPARLTLSVGSKIAEFLDRLVDHTKINASDIHLLGHSLGAHVMGSCGFHFKSGKIGRITGLDPASPGFEIFPVQSERLSVEDADFVDVIHTAAGSLGYTESIGHVDFFPNSGKAPQPGCSSLFQLFDFIFCSHARAYEFYTDSIYNKMSILGVECSSWLDFLFDKCANNTEVVMGHDATPSVKGNYYLKTNSFTPYGIK